jgi:hypothetical protein
VPVLRVSGVVEPEVQEAPADHEVPAVGCDEERGDHPGRISAGGGRFDTLAGVPLEPAGVPGRRDETGVEGAGAGVEGGQLVLVGEAEAGETAGDVEPRPLLGNGGHVGAGLERAEGAVDLAGSRVERDEPPADLSVDPAEFAADVEAAAVS